MSQTRTTVVISSICAEYAASANFRRKTVDGSLMQPSKNGSSYSFYFISKILHCCTAALLSIVAALSPPPTANRFRDVIFRRRSPVVDSDFETLPQLYFPSSQPFTTFSRRRSLSPPPAAGRFRDFIFRRHSLSSTPSVDAAFRRLLASTTSSSVVTAFRRLFTTSSVVAAFHRLQPQVASTTLSSVVAAFRRLLPSTQPFVDSDYESLPQLYLLLSQLLERLSYEPDVSLDHVHAYAPQLQVLSLASFLVSFLLFSERRFHVYMSPRGRTVGRTDGFYGSRLLGNPNRINRGNSSSSSSSSSSRSRSRSR